MWDISNKFARLKSGRSATPSPLTKPLLTNTLYFGSRPTRQHNRLHIQHNQQ